MFARLCEDIKESVAQSNTTTGTAQASLPLGRLDFCKKMGSSRLPKLP